MLQSELDSVHSDVDVDRYQCYQYLVFVRRSVCRCACDRCPSPSVPGPLSLLGTGLGHVSKWSPLLISPVHHLSGHSDITSDWHARISTVSHKHSYTLSHHTHTHTHSIWGLWHDSFALDLVVQIERICVCTGICIGIDIGNNWNLFCC